MLMHGVVCVQDGKAGLEDSTCPTCYGTFDPQDPNHPSDPNDALDRTYAYDPIGNRKRYKEGSDPNTAYTTNNLNQYTATADPNESFTYDDDGNLTDDGTFDYTWDAENRLISVGPVSQPVAGDKRLEFKYDYMGRRVEKAVYAWDPNEADWKDEPEAIRRFVYSDWLLALELDATDPNDVIILRKYTWGLDLAGQGGGQGSALSALEGAGGIGGLLATYDAADTKSYIYFHDANGNLGQLIDRSDGSIDAKYEYDAYGNTITSGGDYADDNPFRFSTKYFDAELDYTATTNDGLYYFGYRYYSPRLGRWINRDPIAEAGGLNVYAYTFNRPGDGVESLGLKPVCAYVCPAGTRGGATWLVILDGFCTSRITVEADSKLLVDFGPSHGNGFHYYAKAVNRNTFLKPAGQLRIRWWGQCGKEHRTELQYASAVHPWKEGDAPWSYAFGEGAGVNQTRVQMTLNYREWPFQRSSSANVAMILGWTAKFETAALIRAVAYSLAASYEPHLRLYDASSEYGSDFVLEGERAGTLRAPDTISARPDGPPLEDLAGAMVTGTHRSIMNKWFDPRFESAWGVTIRTMLTLYDPNTKSAAHSWPRQAFLKLPGSPLPAKLSKPGASPVTYLD